MASVVPELLPTEHREDGAFVVGAAEKGGAIEGGAVRAQRQVALGVRSIPGAGEGGQRRDQAAAHWHREDRADEAGAALYGGAIEGAADQRQAGGRVRSHWRRGR